MVDGSGSHAQHQQLKTKMMTINSGCRNLESTIDSLIQSISLHPSREMAIKEIRNITNQAKTVYMLAMDINKTLKERPSAFLTNSSAGKLPKNATDSGLDPATPEQARTVMYLAIGAMAKEVKRFINSSRNTLQNETWKDYWKVLRDLKDSVHKLQLSATLNDFI